MCCASAMWMSAFLVIEQARNKESEFCGILVGKYVSVLCLCPAWQLMPHTIDIIDIIDMNIMRSLIVLCIFPRLNVLKWAKCLFCSFLSEEGDGNVFCLWM